MNRKPQVPRALAARPDDVPLWGRPLGLRAIWGSICRFGAAISHLVRDIVLDLNELGQQHRQPQHRQPCD